MTRAPSNIVYRDQDSRHYQSNSQHSKPPQDNNHPEDDYEDYIDKENQPAGHEDSHPRQRLSRQQEQQQAGRGRHTQHPGNTSVGEIWADPDTEEMSSRQSHRNLEDTRRIVGGGAGGAAASLDAHDFGSASDQENVRPVRRARDIVPVPAPAPAVMAPQPQASIMLDARQQLLQREKYLAQQQHPHYHQSRPSTAKAELMERSRDSRQLAAAAAAAQQQQQQQQRSYRELGENEQQDSQQLTRQQLHQSMTQRPPQRSQSQREAPGAPIRKRSRQSMEEEMNARAVARGEVREQPHSDHQQQRITTTQDPDRHHRSQQHQHQQQRQQQQPQRQPQQQQQRQQQQQQQEDEAHRKRARSRQQHGQHDAAAGTSRELTFKEKYERLVAAIEYGDVYCDNTYEYRNVTLPKVMLQYIERRFMEKPDDKHCYTLRTLKEEEWRAIGIVMSQYWDNWMRHDPEPHVLLFRRPVGTGERLKKEAEDREEKKRLEDLERKEELKNQASQPIQRHTDEGRKETDEYVSQEQHQGQQQEQ
ncbi:Cyclin-dependent kinases regulatory subunit (Cell division control protein cks1) [Mortierella sp. GBA30]|nr:Cyclin-dependent kinases regulatory subunit (Cell division control protein cks1) [Mortierella sp. GBA30]